MKDTARVGLLDYGMGNLRSVAKALEAAGARVTVSDDASALARAEFLVVPGQGAFASAVAVLKKKKLDRFIKDWFAAGKPYLGICLGLQLLFDSSEEAPGVKGLGLFPGRVRKFRVAGRSLKVPHMGWNEVSWRTRALSRAKENFYYFDHSYFPVPKDRSLIDGETRHGRAFCSAVRRGNAAATQFHPEKSGTSGIRLLRFYLKDLKIAGRAA